MIGVFTATDVFLFYVFFEAMLVPMYFIIGSFGGPRRQYAAMKFFLYSLVGGLLMLASVIGLYVTTGSHSFSITYLIAHPVPDNATQKWLFLGFFIAFAIKAPLVPFHTWLPDAGAEAPSGGAALLVGVLDKVGTFGFLRYCLPLFPGASRYFAPTILILSVIGILYAAFLAIGQRDMKRLVAYTSVAHFGFIGLGIFAFSTQGGTGAVLYMVNHGFSTAGLFIVGGFLVSRRGSKLIADYGDRPRDAALPGERREREGARLRRELGPDRGAEVDEARTLRVCALSGERLRRPRQEAEEVSGGERRPRLREQGGRAADRSRRDACPVHGSETRRSVFIRPRFGGRDRHTRRGQLGLQPPVVGQAARGEVRHPPPTRIRGGARQAQAGRHPPAGLHGGEHPVRRRLRKDHDGDDDVLVQPEGAGGHTLAVQEHRVCPGAGGLLHDSLGRRAGGDERRPAGHDAAPVLADTRRPAWASPSASRSRTLCVSATPKP